MKTKVPLLFFPALFLIGNCFSNNVFGQPAEVTPDQCTLPIYRIYLPPENLAYFYDNFLSDTSFVANFHEDSNQFDCSLSLRGKTSRSYPKKSWNVKFNDESGFRKRELNLNAEYPDKSHCRNTLAMVLANEIGLDAPLTRHISLFINDQYQGVYVEVEEVDDDFFSDRMKDDNGLLIKSVNHGGRFNPLSNPIDFMTHYQIIKTEPEIMDSLFKYFYLLQYGDLTQVNTLFNNNFNMENLLSYFAFRFAIMDNDGFTKNYYFYHDDANRINLIPWDCDASFGNHWTGEWRENYIGQLKNTLITKNNIFTRIIENENSRRRLYQILSQIGSGSFPDLISKTDSIYSNIRNDVYLDPNRLESDEEFDNELTRLHRFINDRADLLATINSFNKPVIETVNVNRAYYSSEVDSFECRVTFEEQMANVILLLLDTDGTWNTYNMDDSRFNCSESPDDRIWSIRITIPGTEPCYKYSLKYRTEDSDYFYWPPSGLLSTYDDVPSIRLSYGSVNSGDISIGPIWKIEGEKILISLVNEENFNLNINGCYLNWGSDFNKILIEGSENISPGDTLFMTNSCIREKNRVPSRNIIGDFPTLAFEAEEVSLERSDQIQVVPPIEINYIPLIDEIGEIVINEINYHSNPVKDPGDWIEFVRTKDNVSITGWRIIDANYNNAYIFTEKDEQEINKTGYLVVSANPEKFHKIFPWVNNYVGGLNFSLSNGGESLSILDENLSEIDVVVYDDNEPWPTQPDGNGPTLELISYILPNNESSAWRSSLWRYPFGTPGMNNSVSENFVDKQININCTLDKVYPNPFDQFLNFELAARKICRVEFSIYNILGQNLVSFDYQVPGQGLYTIQWFPEKYGLDLSSGVYFIKFGSKDIETLYKVVMIK